MIVVIISVTRGIYILYFWENIEDKAGENEEKKTNDKRSKRR